MDRHEKFICTWVARLTQAVVYLGLIWGTGSSEVVKSLSAGLSRGLGFRASPQGREIASEDTGNIRW